MRFFLFSFCALLAACADQSFANGALPNQPAMAEVDQNGTRILNQWSEADLTAPNMKERQTPDNDAFDRAELWMQTISSSDMAGATISAFSNAGLRNTRIISTTSLSPDGIDVLDSHPDANGVGVMVEGMLNDDPALGIAISLYGSTDGSPRSTGVHAFMAPKDKFKALGGFSIVAVKWFQASASPDENMSIEGSLAPQGATDRLALFFNQWVADYVVPMMGLSMQMQMQTIHNMQSWNNAMNACAGIPNCNVVPMNDGSGGWTTSQ